MTKARQITYNGKTQNLAEWSRETGLGWQTLAYRIDAGWPVEAVLSLKPYGGRPLKSARATSLVEALPALPGFLASQQAVLKRTRRDLRRALRVLIQNTEKQAADIGRAYALSVAATLDQAQHGAEQVARGVGPNFPKRAGDRIPSSAQERV